jgi:hypothetical protein
MTQETFNETPVKSGMVVIFQKKEHRVIGVNWLCGSIRCKGHLENYQLPFQECEYKILKTK